jgi:hypothetical protein
MQRSSPSGTTRSRPRKHLDRLVRLAPEGLHEPPDLDRRLAAGRHRYLSLVCHRADALLEPRKQGVEQEAEQSDRDDAREAVLVLRDLVRLRDHVADAGARSGEELRRDDDHPRGPHPDAETGDDRRQRRRQDHVPEHLSPAGAVDDGHLDEQGPDVRDTVRRVHEDGEERAPRDDGHHGQLDLVEEPVLPGVLAVEHRAERREPDDHDGHGDPGHGTDRPHRLEDRLEHLADPADPPDEDAERHGDERRRAEPDEHPHEAHEDALAQRPAVEGRRVPERVDEHVDDRRDRRDRRAPPRGEMPEEEHEEGQEGAQEDAPRRPADPPQGGASRSHSEAAASWISERSCTRSKASSHVASFKSFWNFPMSFMIPNHVSSPRRYSSPGSMT